MSDTVSSSDRRDQAPRRAAPSAAGPINGPVPGRPPTSLPPACLGEPPGAADSEEIDTQDARPSDGVDAGAVEVPRLQQTPKGRRLTKKPETPTPPLTPQQRLLILDSWQRSGLPAGDFAALFHLSKHTLYAWKKKFDTEGPAGLMDKPRGGPEGSRLPELTKRAILMLKQANPDYGVERISALLLRGPGLAAIPAAVAKVLHEAGYELEEGPTKPHPDKVRSFERARPNQLWQVATGQRVIPTGTTATARRSI